MLCSIPVDVRAWVEARAARNLQPMTSVVVTALRTQMDAERRQEERIRRERQLERAEF
jgi:acyl-CoA hydrolase